MKHKKLIILILIIVLLWFTGIIPKQIAKAAGTNYVRNHFPEMRLKCTGIEYSPPHGDYLIYFKDVDENTYGCVIGPKYFPVFMGQGLFAIESDYKEIYK